MKTPGHGQVRRDRRGGRPPRRRSPQGRPDGARHRRAARRAPARTSGSPCSPQGDAAAAARDAGADVVGADDLAAAGRGRHARLRRGHRHARPHAAGRQARPCARPPRPHAEPQDRHRDHRRRPRPSASSRAARSSTAPTATATSTCPIGKVSFERRRPAANFRAVLDELNRAKPSSAKGRYMRKVTVSSTMGPGVKVDPTACVADETAPDLTPADRRRPSR